MFLPKPPRSFSQRLCCALEPLQLVLLAVVCTCLHAALMLCSAAFRQGRPGCLNVL